MPAGPRRGGMFLLERRLAGGAAAGAGLHLQALRRDRLAAIDAFAIAAVLDAPQRFLHVQQLGDVAFLLGMAHVVAPFALGLVAAVEHRAGALLAGLRRL